MFVKDYLSRFGSSDITRLGWIIIIFFFTSKQFKMNEEKSIINKYNIHPHHIASHS